MANDLSIYVDGKYYGPALASAKTVALHGDERKYSLRTACERFGFNSLETLRQAVNEAFEKRQIPAWHVPNDIIRDAAEGRDPNSLIVQIKDDNLY